MQRITNHPVIVLVVVIIITGAIAFFTIYSPKLSIPTLPGEKNQTNQNEDITVSSAPTAVAISKDSNYILQLVDPKSLVNLYTTLKVWDKTYNGTDTKPLTTLIIYLINKPGKTAVKDPSGNVAFSYTADFKKDILELSIYLPEETLNGPAPSAFFGAAVTLAGSQIGGTNMTIPQIPNNNVISKLFTIIPIPKPTK